MIISLIDFYNVLECKKLNYEANNFMKNFKIELGLFKMFKFWTSFKNKVIQKYIILHPLK